MAIFSPQPLKKWIILDFFRQNDAIQEESKCKYVQFLQWILKDDDVYFKKNHSILNLREFFHSEKYRVSHNSPDISHIQRWSEHMVSMLSHE